MLQGHNSQSCHPGNQGSRRKEALHFSYLGFGGSSCEEGTSETNFLGAPIFLMRLVAQGECDWITKNETRGSYHERGQRIQFVYPMFEDMERLMTAKVNLTFLFIG